MRKTLIQANNLDVVIDLFQYIYYHPNYTRQNITDYFNFTTRQLSYYSGACKYLGLLNDDWSLTDFAKDIFRYSSAEVTERVYQRIIEDELIGKVYHRMLEFPDEDILEFGLKLAEEYYPGLSKSVYLRRTNNMVKWCVKINNYLKNK